MSDKTNWRKMLKNDRDNINLLSFKEQAKTYIPSNLIHYFNENSKVLNIDFPVKKFPSKPNSIKLKKNSKFSGKLLGVKGQYLIFDEDKVINYRGHEGHIFQITIGS